MQAVDFVCTKISARFKADLKPENRMAVIWAISKATLSKTLLLTLQSVHHVRLAAAAVHVAAAAAAAAVRRSYHKARLPAHNQQNFKTARYNSATIALFPSLECQIATQLNR